LGFGKKGMEELVAEEVEELCKRLEASNGQYLQMRQFFNKHALRALWKVLTSEELDPERSEMMQIWKKVEKVFDQANLLLPQVILNYPILAPLGELIGIMPFSSIMKDFERVCDKIVTEHEKSYQDESLRDFTDGYLKVRYENASREDSSFYGKNGLLNQRGMMADVMQAGTDTTSITMSWCMLFMAKYPNIQRKVQAELDDKIGRSRLPCWDDRANTPYVEAFLHEIQRIGDIVPNGVPHSTRAEIHHKGYVIPKHTVILVFLSAILKDETKFPNPTKFDPERFMEDGKFKPSPYVIPFGLGKRRCLGETLARIELYRFFTGIVHRFHIVKRPGDELSEEIDAGAIGNPKRFEVKFVPRD